MHETSLIDFALNAVEVKAVQLGIQEISEVGLVVGKAKAVPTLLEKAFQIIRVKHPLCADARLHLDMREIRMRCNACGTEYEVADVMSDDCCPACGCKEGQMISGNELLVEYFVPKEG